MDTRLYRSLVEEDKTRLLQQWDTSPYLRERLLAVVEDELEISRKESDDRAILDNMQLQLAAGVGYRQALQRVRRILGA